MSPRTEEPAILVVGADSVIGGAMLGSLKRSGQPAVGTTRRRDTVTDSRLYLDLSREVNWTDQRPVTAAILCAGVSRLEDCRTDPVGSALELGEFACGDEAMYRGQVAGEMIERLRSQVATVVRAIDEEGTWVGSTSERVVQSGPGGEEIRNAVTPDLAPVAE